MPEISNPGTRMKELRTHLDITQVDFSRALGVPQSNLSPWESGRRAVPTPVLLAVCGVFGASRAWLLDGIGPMFAAELDLTGSSALPQGGIYSDVLRGVLSEIRKYPHSYGPYGRIESTLPPGRARSIALGHDVPTYAELGVIARVIGAPIQELLVNPDGTPMQVDLSRVNPLDPIFPRISSGLPASEGTMQPSTLRGKQESQGLEARVSDLEKTVKKMQAEIAKLKKR